MFYLRQLMSIIVDNKIKSFFFFLTSALFIITLFMSSEIFEKILSSQKFLSKPYLNVLVSTAGDVELVENQLKKLPGVEEIVITSHNENDLSVKNLGLSLETIELVQNKNYKILKIILDKDLNEKSHNLIKEYLSKLFKNDEITFSEIKQPKVQSGAISWEQYELPALLLFGLLWVLSTYYFMKAVELKSYLIEKFQRKDQVTYKIFLTAMGIILCPTLLVPFYTHNGKLREFALLAIVISFTLLISKKKTIFKRAI